VTTLFLHCVVHFQSLPFLVQLSHSSHGVSIFQFPHFVWHFFHRSRGQFIHVSPTSIIQLPHDVGQNISVHIYEHQLFQFSAQLSHFSRSVFFTQSQQYGFVLSTIISHVFEHNLSLPFLSPWSHCSQSSTIPFQHDAVHPFTSSGQFIQFSASSTIQLPHFAVHGQIS